MKDMNLSKRMETVVSMVSPQSFTIADVGCDHAYVSIALIARSLAQKVVAMDVRKGPLDIAKRNVSEAGYLEKIDIRLGDGLERLQPGEADAVVIAGMGGLLIKGILERGKDILFCEAKRPVLILQPQSDLKEVRIFLYQHAYHIVQEKMLVEDGKYYTVMKAEPVYHTTGKADAEERAVQSGDKPDMNRNNHNLNEADVVEGCKTEKIAEMYMESGYTEAEWVYGRYNLEHKSEILLEYLQKEQAVLKQIQNKIEHSIAQSGNREEQIPESTRLRMKSVREEIARNEQALSYYTSVATS